MKRKHFLNKKSLNKIIYLIAILLIMSILISSSTISSRVNKNLEIRNLKLINYEFQRDLDSSSDKALKIFRKNSSLTQEIISNDKNNEIKITNHMGVPSMFGYVAYDPSGELCEGPCYFPLNDPSNITMLDCNSNFLTGGTWTFYEKWVGVDYGNGILWEIDPETGDMFSIGGKGEGLSGLAYDPLYNRLYGSGDDDYLYEVDPDTGEQEQIGPFGSGVQNMIGMTFDSDGILYGWDLGNDKLWIIDLESGEATEVGPLGIDLNYTQDGAFDWYTDTIYLAAYTTKGQLYKCDKTTGECTLVGDFQGDAEITCCMIKYNWCTYHDVGIKDIVKPVDGYANEDMEVIVQVENHENCPEEDISVNVVILKEGFEEEYNETENIEIINPGTMDIEMPIWTPNDWQNETDGYIDYKITAYATVWGDDNTSNDYKEEWFRLFYPWLHDIEVKSIDSPCKDGPGKTYPVQATIKNVGQYAECCIPIEIIISETIIQEIFLNENTWDTVPPEGWYDEHKYSNPYYGWKKSYSSKSGGISPEAVLTYNRAISNYVMYSYAIDTSEYSIIQLGFKSYIHHYYGQGLYSLEAGYSTDKENWYAVWHEEPGSSSSYNVDVPIEGGSNTTYIGFWVKGNTDYFYKWYIDNVELVTIGFIEEYSDFACQGPDLQPGEEVNFTFEDWTPNFLQNATTSTKNYIIKAKINMKYDENSYNDVKDIFFTLDFWHDIGIDEIVSPYSYPCKDGDIKLWDNGLPDGRNALPGSMYEEYSNILIDDFENFDEIWSIQGGLIHFVWNNGYTSNLEKIKLYIFESEEKCDPSLIEYAVVEANTFDEYTTGDYYFGRPEIVVNFLLDEQIPLTDGNWYLGIQPDGIKEDIAYLLTTEFKRCQVMADLPYYEYPRWTSSQHIWGEEYDFAWEIHGSIAGCHPPRALIKPGNQEIVTVVKNYGTFPEENLTCYAKIKEYITDPEWGTSIHIDEIENIDLLNPLGGKKELKFEDFTFIEEGLYRLFLNLPYSSDNFKRNNKMKLIIIVDGTCPISNYPPILDPIEPNGNNGWYVDNVEVTLNATDPRINGYSSGVKEIRYTINGGSERIIHGGYGNFMLTDEGEDIIIEYWAVDMVDNVETPKKSFAIDIDKTLPDVKLEYKVTGGNPLTGWKLTFTATANDKTSGMDYVTFYLNDEIQKTITGSGPTYQWTYTYYGGVKMIITAVAYDKAGNYESDQIINPTVCIYSNQKSNQMHSKNSNILKLPRIR